MRHRVPGMPPDWAGLYTLAEDGMTPVPEADTLAWSRWMETADRRVSEDYDEADGDRRIRISTVFLGLDHNWQGGGDPLLWETMVFGGPLDGEMARYSTHAEAVAGHQAMCQRVRAALSPP